MTKRAFVSFFLTKAKASSKSSTPFRRTSLPTNNTTGANPETSPTEEEVIGSAPPSKILVFDCKRTGKKLLVSEELVEIPVAAEVLMRKIILGGSEVKRKLPGAKKLTNVLAPTNFPKAMQNSPSKVEEPVTTCTTSTRFVIERVIRKIALRTKFFVLPF